MLHTNDVGGWNKRPVLIQSNHKTLILLYGMGVNSHLPQALFLLISAHLGADLFVAAPT